MPTADPTTPRRPHSSSEQRSVGSLRRKDQPTGVQQNPTGVQQNTERQRAAEGSSRQETTKHPLGQPLRIELPPIEGADRQARAEAVLQAAQEAFAKTDSWVIAFRELLGRNGVARQAFPDPESYEWFTTSKEYADLQEMIAAMRSQDTSKGNAVEPERMITIRLPCSLHDTLADEADAASLSVNKLCISKLIQPISSRFIPIQQGERRGRRPGPQGSRKKSTTTSPSTQAS